MDNKTISNILNQRKELVQLISVAVLLAFGVSLLASILPNVLSINDVQSLLLGVILILVGIGYLIVLITRSRTGRVLVHANVLFDPKSESTIAPFKYKFMFDLSQALAAVFQENTALKNTWHSHPLTTWHQPSEETKIPSSEGETSAPSPEGEIAKNSVEYISIHKMLVDDDVKPSKSAELLLEATEFVILEQLSNHLSEYFDNSKQNAGIKKLSRKDIPHILLENRVLNLLTTPIEDRAIFSESGIKEAPEEGELVSMQGSDGSIYERFDLTLPAGTTVNRSGNGALILDAKRVVLSIRCVYEGTSDVLPSYFEEGYLGMPSMSVDALNLDIEIVTKIRLRALLSLTGWWNFRWIDSFPDRLVRYADFRYFLKVIGWNTAFTSFHISHAFKLAKKTGESEGKDNCQPNLPLVKIQRDKGE